MRGKPVTITVDPGDAEAAYKFLRQSALRIREMTRDMDPIARSRYLDQPDRWDAVAVELGHAVGEEGLQSLSEMEKNG